MLGQPFLERLAAPRKWPGDPNWYDCSNACPSWRGLFETSSSGPIRSEAGILQPLMGLAASTRASLDGGGGVRSRTLAGPGSLGVC